MIQQIIILLVGIKKADSYCIAVKVSLFNHFPSYKFYNCTDEEVNQVLGKLLPFMRSFYQIKLIYATLN